MGMARWDSAPYREVDGGDWLQRMSLFAQGFDVLHQIIQVFGGNSIGEVRRFHFRKLADQALFRNLPLRSSGRKGSLLAINLRAAFTWFQTFQSSTPRTS